MWGLAFVVEYDVIKLLVLMLAALQHGETLLSLLCGLTPLLLVSVIYLYAITLLFRYNHRRHESV